MSFRASKLSPKIQSRDADVDVLHRRLGHPSTEILKHMIFSCNESNGKNKSLALSNFVSAFSFVMHGNMVPTSFQCLKI